MSEATIKLTPSMFAVADCESCGDRHFCAPMVCEADAAHRHWCCSGCAGILSLRYDKERTAFVARRCPPIVNEAEMALVALKELPRG